MAAQAAMKIADGYFASQNAIATAKLNEDIYEMNKEYAELDAYDSLVEGEAAQARYQSVIDNTLAEQSAIMKAQDIDTSYGSAASVAAESSFAGQLNLMDIQKQAQMKALGYQTEARNIALAGGMKNTQDMYKAGEQMRSGIQSGIQTGLSGYKDFKQHQKDMEGI